MDADLVGKLWRLRRRIRRLDDILVLKTARSRNHAFHGLVPFQENLLGIQRGLGLGLGLFFTLHLHLENELLQSLFRLGIGKKKRIPFDLVAKRL